VFNAIGTQTAFLKLDDDSRNIAELLTTMLSGVSVFVAVVLGLLIVYASRFLMKRRNKEFALYLTLGMSKGKISFILLIETILIGLGSLIVGLTSRYWAFPADERGCSKSF
jgi:putative ABC transport system permease protein